MHIMEGYLPPLYCAVWTAASAPAIVQSVRSTARIIAEKRSSLLLLGAAGGFCFILSALKLPSVTGSSSHPTGIGLGAILFGPWVMVLVGTIVLAFQALLLGHLLDRAAAAALADVPGKPLRVQSVLKKILQPLALHAVALPTEDAPYLQIEVDTVLATGQVPCPPAAAVVPGPVRGTTYPADRFFPAVPT